MPISPDEEILEGAGDTSIADMPQIVVISGMSGAGRTEAMHVFEDLGYFCVDNLPANLIRNLIDLNMVDISNGNDVGYKRIAIVCDARNGTYFENLTDEVDSLKASGRDVVLLFLDASDAQLIARYKASRRRHPLFVEGSTISGGIERERRLMAGAKSKADIVIDTTDMLPQQLRRRIREIFASGQERRGLAITVYSFGFKHGAPVDADIVIDVRFLPNPYWEPDLKHLTGLDKAVREFVMLRDEAQEFNRRWQGLLDVLLPGYVEEGKQQLCIAIGCTGGQHRSVCIAESTSDYIKSKGYRVSCAHRDLALL